MSNDMNPRKPVRPRMPRKGPNGDDEGSIGRIMRTVLVWLTIFVGVAVIFMIMKSAGTQPVPVSYNQYQELLDQGLIESATVFKSQLNDYEFRG